MNEELEEIKSMIRENKEIHIEEGKQQERERILKKLIPIIEFVRERCSMGIGRLNENVMLERLEEFKEFIQKGERE